MRKPIHPSNTRDSLGSSNTACPAALLSMPVIGAGILISSITLVTSTPPMFLSSMAALLLLYWPFALWQTQRLIDNRSQPNNASNLSGSQLSAKEAILLGTLGGPLAPILVAQALRLFLMLLALLNQTIEQIFPSDLPLIQSAVWLANTSSTMACLTISLVVATLCQQRLAQAIATACLNSQSGTKLESQPDADVDADAGTAASRKRCRRFSLSGLFLAVFLIAPACFWLLGNSDLFAGSLSQSGLEQDWTARLYLCIFLTAAGAFGILSWWQYRLRNTITALAGNNDVNTNHDSESNDHAA